MRNLYLTLVLCLFSISTFAQDESNETSISEHFLGNFEQDWMIVLGFGTTGTKVDHTETSNIPGFAALGAVNDVAYTSYSLTVIKELFHQKRLSVSLLANAAFNMGGQSGSQNNVNFDEDLSGLQYGFGFTANLNYFYSNMKIQPYAGASAQLENTTLEMQYNNGSDTVTTYNYSGMAAHVSLGIRILDPGVGLMSFFNLSYINSMNEEIEAKAKVGGTEGALNVVDVSKSNIFASLGFGFIF